MDNLTPTTAQDVAEAKILTSLKESEKILGIGSKPYDIPDLLKNFLVQRVVKIENKEAKEDLRLLTDAKNILLRPQIEKQVEKNGKFDLTGQIPFENICPVCNGLGEKLKFYRKTVGVVCKYCDGGTKIITCNACKGTGRYKRERDGLIINVECNKCHGEGKRKVKCRKCRGKGTFMKMTIDHHIKSTTHCKTCKGLGFIPPEPEKKIPQPDNPALPYDLGQQIKGAVVSE